MKRRSLDSKELVIHLTNSSDPQLFYETLDQFKVLLFNDNGNTREYVSRSLVLVVGLPEEEAFRIMQHVRYPDMAFVTPSNEAPDGPISFVDGRYRLIAV